MAALSASASAANCTLPDARPAPVNRTYVSPAVDAAIAALRPRFLDPDLGTLFANSLPNCLDTTVYRHDSAPGAEDTFVITGDIAAMWLRDSTNQVWPYLRWVADDVPLRVLLRGLIRRQVRCVLRGPYFNAFNVDHHAAGPHADDVVRTAIPFSNYTFEGKWEADSLSNVLRLSSAFYNATLDTTPFDGEWIAAVRLILATFAEQRASSAQEDAAGTPLPYFMQRSTGEPSDSLEHGRGNPAAATGMIKSAFRGSDDATIFAFNIPENAFAVVALESAGALLDALGYAADAAAARALAAGVRAAIASHGVVTHPFTGERVYAFEVDGFGSVAFMDDANVPGLLSLPVFGFVARDDPVYLATRAVILSNVTNPYFYVGPAGEGIGGPHNGAPYIWPMAIMSRGMTATTDAEVAAALDLLVSASACTGFNHESFRKENVTEFTRVWFSWANSLFGEFVLQVAAERPNLIFSS